MAPGGKRGGGGGSAVSVLACFTCFSSRSGDARATAGEETRATSHLSATTATAVQATPERVPVQAAKLPAPPSIEGASQQDVAVNKDQGAAAAAHAAAAPSTPAAAASSSALVGAWRVDLDALEGSEEVACMRGLDAQLHAVLEVADAAQASARRATLLMLGRGKSAAPGEPERLAKELAALCSAVGPPDFTRASQLLGDMAAWLSCATHVTAAAELVNAASPATRALQQLVAASGSVAARRLPAANSALVALARCHAVTVERCLAAASTSRLAASGSLTLRGQPGAAHTVKAVAASQEEAAAAVATLARRLVRPELIDLLGGTVAWLTGTAPASCSDAADAFPAPAEFVYSRGGSVASDAGALCDLLRALFDLADARADAVGEARLAACIDRIAAMLDPTPMSRVPGGAAGSAAATAAAPSHHGFVPRLLSRPPGPALLSLQLPVLRLLQRLYDGPASVLARALVRPGSAAHYVYAHYSAAATAYYASGGRPDGGCARVAEAHARLLHALVRARLPAVAAAAAATGVLGLLLREVEEEEAAAADADDNGDDSAPGVPAGCGDGGQFALYSSEEESDDDAAGGASGEAPPGGKFRFCFDLNEDLERLLDLEDQGADVAVPGLEYDEEGLSLLERSEAMAAEAERAAAAAAVAPTPSFSADPGADVPWPREACWPTGPAAAAPPGSVPRPSHVPKLSFSGSASRQLSNRSTAPSSGGGGGGVWVPTSQRSGSFASASASATSAAAALHSPYESAAAAAAAAMPSPCDSAAAAAAATMPSPYESAAAAAAAATPTPTHRPPSTPQQAQTADEELMPPPGSTLKLGLRLGSIGSVGSSGSGGAGGATPVPALDFSALSSSAPGRSGSRAGSGRGSGSAERASCGGNAAPGSVPRLRLPASSAGGSGGAVGCGSEPASQRSARPPLSGMHRSDGGSALLPPLSSSRGHRHAILVSSNSGAAPAAQQGPSTAGTGAAAAAAPAQEQTGPSVRTARGGAPATADDEFHSCCAEDIDALLEDAPDGGDGENEDGEGVAACAGRSELSSHRGLHLLLLRTALELVLTPGGDLAAGAWQQYPLDNGCDHNLEWLLTRHLNGGSDGGVTRALLPQTGNGAVGKAGGNGSAGVRRLLRLMSRQLFDEGRYSELKFHARGAFGAIYLAKARAAGSSTGPVQQVVIKTVELPGSKFERCVLPDMYGEVLILERYRGRAGICQMLDYGLTRDAYWIVMKKYRCSLSEWRSRQRAGPGDGRAAHLYLSVLLQVVAALRVLADDSVVHFDLKCSNVLIDPNEGVKDTQLWNPLSATASAPGAASGYASEPAANDAGADVGSNPVPSHAAGGDTAPSDASAPPPVPPFTCVLADFGEARSYRSADEAFTVRNRGTEVYKSPEMLLLNAPAPSHGSGSTVGGAPTPAEAAAKAALSGAGLASDVWSLGCLSYELLTGRVLFGGDYASVTHRVAFGNGPCLALNASEVEALGGRAELVGLVEWVLERDPAQRPSLSEIEARVARVQAGLVMQA